MKSKRTQPERTAQTRAALMSTARRLFATKGYAGVSTDELATAAGVTRGALYHQFGGKEELFLAVFEHVEQEIVDRLAAGAGDVGTATDPVLALHDDIASWLSICAEPDVHRIVLIDAPAVLGWDTWRGIGLRYGVGLVEMVLQGLLDAGVLAPQPVRPLAHVLVGALEEGALYAARAEDRAAATADVQTALESLVDGLVRGPRRGSP